MTLYEILKYVHIVLAITAVGANLTYGLLFVTGVAMIFVGRIPWTTPWLLTAIVLYVAMMLFAVFGYTPLLRRQIAALLASGPESAEFRALAGPSIGYGIGLAVVVLVIAFLMVTKPALWG